VGHHREFGRKALDVLGFFFEKTHWDEEGKIGVFVAGFLEPPIEFIADFFPDRVAARSDHHAALDRRIICQFCIQDDVDVPLRIVDFARRNFLCHLLHL
jgi:hypothetical protein